MRIEWDFRYSKAEGILNELRGYLLLRSHMWKSKNRHAIGQRMHTRSLQLLSDVEEKVKSTVSAYKRTYHALENLCKPLLENRWKFSLKPLDDGDVIGLSSMEDVGSEGRKRLSWIWKVHGMDVDADECTQEGMTHKLNICDWF